MGKQYYIYEIYNDVTQKKYIGLTSDYKNRFYSHMLNLKNGTHTAEGIVKDCVKYGIEHFSFRLIDTALTEYEGREKEKHYMVLYQTWNPEKGYNGLDQRFKVAKLPQYKLKLNDNLITQLLRRRCMGLHSLAKYMNMDCNLLFQKLNNPMLFTGQELREAMGHLYYYRSFSNYLYSKKEGEKYLKRLRNKINAEVI